MANEPLTKTDLAEFARGPLREVVKAEFDSFSAGPMRTIVREEIGEFTEEVLLPAVERIIDDRVPPIVERIVDERVPRIVDQKLGVHRDQMIDYIDRRIGSAVGELTATIRGDRERYRDVFMNLIDVLKRNQLINDEEQLRVVKMIP